MPGPEEIDTVLLLRGNQQQGPRNWRARAIPCAPDRAQQLTRSRSSRRKHHRPMLAVIIHGLGRDLSEAAARRRAEVRLRGAVLHARTRLYDLLHHGRLRECALPLVLELEVREGVVAMSVCV